MFQRTSSKAKADDLGLLLLHEQGRPNQPLLEALLGLRIGDHPVKVHQAVDRLVRKHAPWAINLAVPVRRLIEAAGNQRDQRLFIESSLNPDRVTFEELAENEDICRQQVNVIVRRAEGRVRQALPSAPAPLPWAVSALSSQVGTVTTKERLGAAVYRLGAVEPLSAQLLAWLVGPFSPVPDRPGWLAVEPKEVVRATSVCVAADGGVRRLADVEAELARAGIRTADLGDWLAANGAITILDLVVSVAGSLSGAVERILDAYGTARTNGEIASDLGAAGRPVDPDAVDRAVGAGRFVRSNSGAVRLKEWGDENPPKTMPARTRRADRNRAGPARTGSGKRKPEAKDQVRFWLWVRVDADVLRGTEAAVPAALIEGLGLASPARRTFSSRWGPVTLGCDGSGPTRSSVRAVAMAAGARLDDTLLLGFSAAGDVDVEVRRGPGQISAAGIGATAGVLFPELFPETVNGGNQ